MRFSSSRNVLFAGGGFIDRILFYMVIRATDENSVSIETGVGPDLLGTSGFRTFWKYGHCSHGFAPRILLPLVPRETDYQIPR